MPSISPPGHSSFELIADDAQRPVRVTRPAIKEKNLTIYENGPSNQNRIDRSALLRRVPSAESRERRRSSRAVVARVPFLSEHSNQSRRRIRAAPRASVPTSNTSRRAAHFCSDFSPTTHRPVDRGAARRRRERAHRGLLLLLRPTRRRSSGQPQPRPVTRAVITHPPSGTRHVYSGQPVKNVPFLRRPRRGRWVRREQDVIAR